MPLVASVVLSTDRLLRGFILAPDESSKSWTFVAMPVTSNPLRGMTLSLSLTRVMAGIRECPEGSSARKDVR